MLKRIFNYMFNDNVGYFINKHTYYFEGVPYIGYVICQGFRFFGIYGYTHITHAHDEETLMNEIKRLNIPLQLK